MARPKKITDPTKQNKPADAAETSAKKTEKDVKEAVKVSTKTARKAAGEKKSSGTEAKVSVMLQYAGKDISYDELVQNAKNKFQYDMGGDADAVKKINLYVKPDENRVYFVIDDNIEGDYLL